MTDIVTPEDRAGYITVVIANMINIVDTNQQLDLADTRYLKQSLLDIQRKMIFDTP